jgi:hypothetical protein
LFTHYLNLSAYSLFREKFDQLFILNDYCFFVMGRIDKGVNCSVQGCEEKGERSITSSKAQMAPDLDLDLTGKRAYLCRTHYKEWKKATKEERENERARWG